ncbi:BadF/BadG/BcrA/BcrD ATPase family protein [Sphingomonas oligophenolica]|uniref:BadF/BadG/BcrA/BcrD ATPase family protein n=1 Tax=Sphingomonas oligophenolica TaxID=301154 RepID=A0ABU9Y1H3_9SPHN
MSERRYFLGVDGGGTKTEFVCIDGDRKVVARIVTGTTYHLQVGLENATSLLARGVAGICHEAGITPDDLGYAFFGLPAFGEDAVVDPQLEQACGRILHHGRYACGNDMICGWAGSLGCEDGINLVAGTGSIGYGERRGQAARVGGWGEVFSDEGSAYWIAIQGLNAFTRMSDGRLPPGPLHAGFRRALGLSNDLELCARIMGEHGMARDEIAGLAPIISEAAEAGDPVAVAILDRAGRELADMAKALRHALGFTRDEAPRLSWSGGVLTGERAVREALKRALALHGDYSLIEPLHDPGVGAALYARHLAVTKR